MRENESIIETPREIENCIYTIRGLQVMLDRDLARLYDVETKKLNQAVKRNHDRFPNNFMFQLTENDWNFLRSQIVTLKSIENPSSTDNRGRHRKYLPYAFTEHGVSMLSAVLKSEIAVITSISIMNAFVSMRRQLLSNAQILQRLDSHELKHLEANAKFEQIFKALESNTPKPDKGIFFDGQVFDAYSFVAEIIKSAKTSILILDNFADETVLTLLTKRNIGVEATIYTKQLSKQLQLDLEKHNAQYPSIAIKTMANCHDRFMIIDQNELYHIGASLKDLGKKWFAFSRMDSLTEVVLERLNESNLEL